VADDIAVMQQ